MIKSSLKVNEFKASLFFTFLFLFLLNSSSIFAQSTVATNDNNIENSTPSDSKVDNIVITESKNSNVNFILWFMGSKEDMGNSYSDNGVYSKKNFMISGREPNRLLVKTLLKKTLNIKTC